ncbi:shikimate kinase [Clostridium sp. WILCCON 0269]|uniref:Shikimate kinase n=1 Tax=Candidatus Clostridium eludens TaxID=3381663 RepID=A0ABW8SN98_9CLOT
MKKQIKNIVIIGMPGCGKTTIGKMVSSKLNKKFVDLDDYIEHKENCTIPEIFQRGEEYFRSLESKAAEEVSLEENLVISTGGGVIKNKQNIINLKKNGVVIFVDRPLKNIIGDVDISTRPLLRNGTAEIEKLFQERYGLYNSYCDFSVYNICDIEKTVDDIIEIYKNCV